MESAVIILAAGKGTRMQSDLPKVLHQIGQTPMLIHAIQSAQALKASKTIVVTGHGADAVGKAAQAYDADVILINQDQQNGTGHAVAICQEELADFSGHIFVLYGDTPFVSPMRLSEMNQSLSDGAAVAVLGFDQDVPNKYGKLVRSADGKLQAIVEAKDSSAEQAKIRLANSGVIAAKAPLLFDLLSELDDDNASGEVYLTDIVAKARARSLECAAIECSASEAMGVNSRADLAVAEAMFQTQKRAEALANGVTLEAPETVYFAFDTQIGRDVLIEPNVVFGPNVTIETGARIRAFSHIEAAHVGADAIVGPYARLRPGTELGNAARVGNFVEIKNAEIGEGAKVNHLSYIGDAVVGDEANIGAGTITCNYDGVNKHQTVIGKRAFIGSNTALVAPVSVGDDAMTGSGSVITRDVPDEALAISRAKQENKDGFATKLFEKLKKIKASNS